MYQDAHFHLQDCDGIDVRAFLAAARQKNIGRFFCNGTCPRDWPAVKRISALDPGVIPFYGVHPWCVREVSTGWKQALVRVLEEDSRAKVGEIGLDVSRDRSGLGEQTAILAQHVRIASEFRRPFVLHCVGAWQLMFDILDKREDPYVPFMVHRFCGSPETARELIQRGGYISCAPDDTDAGKARLSAILASIPDERLLLETDYPAIPARIAQGRSYAELLAAVYAHVAALKKIDVERLQKIVWTNGKIFTD